ncbi:MAG: hypothetical protein K2F81_09500 [Ruminococcus sp.]|nr:hypothetical protein [Ruminococcus sp.]
MKKILKNNIGFILSIVFVAAVVGMVWNAIYSLKPPDKKDTEKYFERDKEDLVLVTEYFANCDYTTMYIKKSNYEKGIIFTSSDKFDIKIEDKAVIKAINRLIKRRNYKMIKRNGNTIYFEIWSFGEKSCGIAYSINGEAKPVIQYLTELEPFSENGWYYYEADYEESRTR